MSINVQFSSVQFRLRLRIKVRLGLGLQIVVYKLLEKATKCGSIT